MALTIELLIATCCLDVIYSKEKWCWGNKGENLFSNNMWLWGRETVHSWFLPLSFQRWHIMGMSPVMASIPIKGKVQKVPKIHITALCCILLSLLIGYNSGTLL